MASTTSTRLKTALLGSVFALGLAGSAYAQSATGVNTGFIVDESGSMGGEHDFLRVLIDPLDTELGNVGFTTRGYGLVGYGSGSIDPVAYGPAGQVATGVFMDTTDFKAATNNLRLNGGTEDGYDGLDFFMNRGGYSFDPTVGSIAVLVTDEDRDTFNGSVDFNSVLTSLDTLNTALVAVVNLPIFDSNSGQAILTDGTSAFVADGTGGFVKTTGFTFGAGSGTTKADYADLALDPQTPAGCVADLNVLRSTDPMLQQSFAAALQECIVFAAQSSGGGASGGTVGDVMAGGQWVLTTWAQRLVSANSDLIFRNRDGSTVGNTSSNFASTGNNARYGKLMAESSIRKLRNDRESGRGLLSGAEGDDGLYMDTNSGGAYGRLTGYLVGAYTNADYDNTASSVGFDIDAVHVVAGADYDAYGGQGSIAVGRIGFGIGYADGESDLDDGSKVDADSRSLLAYGIFRFTSGLFVNASAHYAMTDYDFARATGGGFAQGSPEGDEWGGAVQVGKDYALKSGDSNITLTPNARVLYINNDISGYQETGPGALYVAPQESDSWIGELGLEGTVMTKWAHGPLALHGSATYIRNLDDDNNTVRYGATPGNLTSVRIPDGDDDLGRVGAGFTAFVDGTRGQQLRLVYEHTFADELSEHKVIGRFRMPLQSN